ncbi:hypothetical protein A2U01_0113921, partial [Trifolium medium]|nr:hypothetical protein [Trifolium medium]
MSSSQQSSVNSTGTNRDSRGGHNTPSSSPVHSPPPFSSTPSLEVRVVLTSIIAAPLTD